MNDNAPKTADYTRRAIDNYRAKKDSLTVFLDKGTKQKILDKYGDKITLSKYIQSLIDKDLNN